MENDNLNSRRKFLGDSIKATAAISFIGGTVSSILTACSNTKNLAVKTKFITSFVQQPLPYAYDALENVIDTKTMEIHYSKHAAAYCKNLLEASTSEGVDTNKPLEDVLTKISKYSTKMRNNAGGHYNHEMFWKCMQPKSKNNIPSSKLMAAIEKSFGSFDNFKKQFADAAKSRFGSGWAWLYVDANNSLKIGSTANQDNPMMDICEIKGLPLLGLDVWEHAYYLKYQNKRVEYIENWWDIVNWNYVESRL